MSLKAHSKDELIKIIQEMREKLKEMKPVEARLNADAAELPSPALGLHKDTEGYFHIVHIKYDANTGAAAIDRLDKVDSKDEAIVIYKLRQLLIEGIVRKAQGGKYNV